MGPYAYHVTTEISWKGQLELTSNVFHYDFGPGTPTEAGFLDLANSLVNLLKPIFSTQVKFKQVRVHGPTDQTKADDVMRAILDLNAPGTNTSGQEISSEQAILVSSFVGRGPKGGKQYLRKYFHCYAIPGGAGAGPSSYGRGQLSADTQNIVKGVMNNAKTITIGGIANTICTPKGKGLPVGSVWDVHPYIVGRQFRRRGKRRQPDPATV